MNSPLHDRQRSAPVALEPVRTTGRQTEGQKIKAIRELLVGDEISGLSKRFDNLEGRIQSHHSKLDRELMTRFETWQVLSKSEIDEFGKSVAEMVNQLQKEDASLTAELGSCKERLGNLEKRVDEMEESVTEQVRKMRDDFSRQMGELSRLVQNQQDTARQAVSRKDFAKVLNGLAGSLVPQMTETGDRQ